MLTSDHIAEITSATELAHVMAWVDDLTFILNSKPQKHAIELVAQRRNCSTSIIHQKLRTYKTEGPLSLRDKRRLKGALIPALYGHRSPAFRQWVESLYYQAKRANATPTIQGQMIMRLKAWRQNPTDPHLAIPGYDSPPLDSAESKYKYPRGWSQRQLNDIKPDAYNLALGQTGRQKANLQLAPVLTSRKTLHVGELYMLDDQYYDLKVQYGSKLVRPVGLDVLDYYSGCKPIIGIRPELPDNPEGEKTLCRRDTMWLVVGVLTVFGYYPVRCRFDLESGTSTVDDEFARMIRLASDNIVDVKIHESSKEIVKGVLAPSKGNPRNKAAIESSFNLLRNRMASLPLALGQSKDHKPEDTDRLEAEANKLLKIAEQLSPEDRANLRLDFGLSWNKFVPLANHFSELINQRTDHNLEGYAEMGLEKTEFRLDNTWISEAEYLDLPTEIKAVIALRMQHGEIVSRVEKYSPREVFDMGRGKLKKISPFQWHLLIPHRYAIPRTIPANRFVEITGKEYGPAPIQFQSLCIQQDGTEKPLPAGKDVLIFLNPHTPQFALFTDTAGRPIGLVATINKGTRFDMGELEFQWGQRATLKAQIGASAESYNKQIGEERIERREHNQQVLKDAGIRQKKTPSKKPKKQPRKTVNIDSREVEILPPLPAPKKALPQPAETDPEEDGIGLF